MRCPHCGAESEVKDSRPCNEGRNIRRRRNCTSCGARFTTYEIAADSVGNLMLSGFPRNNPDDVRDGLIAMRHLLDVMLSKRLPSAERDPIPLEGERST